MHITSMHYIRHITSLPITRFYDIKNQHYCIITSMQYNKKKKKKKKKKEPNCTITSVLMLILLDQYQPKVKYNYDR